MKCPECGVKMMSINHRCNPYVRAKYRENFNWDEARTSYTRGES